MIAAMTDLGKKREKQMETIVWNTARFAGNGAGPIGSSPPELPQFQPPVLGRSLKELWLWTRNSR
jgi:hypothetical protein